MVYGVIPAYGRPDLLARALASLATERPALAGVIVVNNSCDEVTRQVAAASPVPTWVVNPDRNLGTAGGIAAGLREFQARPDATHAWILDDDAVAMPGALAALLAGMSSAGADLAAPLIGEADGLVRWVPVRLRPRKGGRLRRGLTPEGFIAEWGAEPRSLHWAIWASLLVTRRAVEAVDPPRQELWSQFSDIEYTLRVTAAFRGVLVPRALCLHVPPRSEGPAFDAKLLSALQNGSYVSFHSGVGRRFWRHLPGLNLRYLRHYRWRPRAWGEVLRAFWRGGVLGRPG